MTIVERVNAERVLIAAWPRAILLQLAHPLVAAGVRAHSSFGDAPATAAGRLADTVRAMLSLTFGSEADRARTLETIRAIHRRVNGVLGATVGPFPSGTPYSAEDPALVLWVHITLVESVLDLYGRVVQPIAEADRSAYCAESAAVACALGALPCDVPRSWPALRDSLETAYGSGAIVVGPDARAVGAVVLTPPLGALAWPLARASRAVTTGLLPPGIRLQYGLAWTGREERAFKRNLRRLGAARRVLPAWLAHWPAARRRRRD